MNKTTEKAAEWWNDPQSQPSGGWVEVPSVGENINRRASDDPAIDWLNHSAIFLSNQPKPVKALSVGCGFGIIERVLRQRDICQTIDGLDVAEKAIQGARKKAEDEGLKGLTYHVADLNTVSLPEETYDVVYAHAAMQQAIADAAIPPEVFDRPTVDNILRAQAAVEEKVNHALDAGALPIVIGQNSPCGSYAIAKPIAERSHGNVGHISIDTHWDSQPIDRLTMDPRIAGSGSWKAKMYEFHKNFTPQNMVEIGERGMLERKEIVRGFIEKGAHFYGMWKIRRELGIEGLCKELHHAYDGTADVYVHFDMDVLGGAGPAPGDILGELAEPIGMTDYEVIRLAHEIGKRGVSGFSFICIPPGSAVIYRTIVYVIMYMLAGRVLARQAGGR